jgi:hypothetical protein
LRGALRRIRYFPSSSLADPRFPILRQTLLLPAIVISSDRKQEDKTHYQRSSFFLKVLLWCLGSCNSQ